MDLSHLSTNTPASNVSSKDFDDGSVSADLEVKSLDDILRNSPAAELLGIKGSLPEEDDGVPNPDDSEEEQQEAQEDSEESENDLNEEEESEETEEENTDEDDASTQDSELPAEEDIDWEYKVPVTVDGKTEYVTLEEIRKGYSTDKHLSQKGRELGELKKQIEQERGEKLQELVTLGSVIHQELTAVENKLSAEYHKIKGEIDTAREEGDTYTARELKEKLEEVQEKYWNARNKREENTNKIAEQFKAQQEEQQKVLLKEFNEKITEVIPDFSEKTAKSIREFALKEGLPEGILDVIYDANIVKFINDYRKLKTAKETGEVKRKAAPKVKSVPSKKGTPQSQKEKQTINENRSKVLSGQGSNQDQLDFLKRISSVSKKL
jgi:membrane-associated HD superfamily phosphohydrolase